MNEVSTQHDKFLTHYQDFLTHFQRYQEIVKGIEQTNFATQTFLLQLYQEAKQAYGSATDSYQQAVQADLEYREKIFTKTLKSN